MTAEEAEQLVEETISRTENLKMKRIAITGSIGKTTVREMITCIVEGSMKTIHTPGSANSTQAVSRTLLKADESTECAVMECGTGGSRGIISRCSRMIRPDVAIVTMIGTSHIGNFGSREAIFDAKIRILDGLRPDGTILLNMDDDLLLKADVKRHHCVMVSRSNPDADVYAKDTAAENGSTSFTACFRSSKDNGSKGNTGKENAVGPDCVPVILHEMAPVNVRNALFAMKAAELVGIDHETAAKRLSGYRTSGIRQNLTRMNGAEIILDCYNASEESIHAALDFMDHLDIGGSPRNLRIALIGDVLELGKYTIPIHQKIGDDLNASRADLIILYGDGVAYIPPRITDSHKVALRFSRNERGQLTEYLARTVHAGDLLLVKGSHGMNLAEVVKDAFSEAVNGTVRHAASPVQSRTAFLQTARRRGQELGLGQFRFTMPSGLSGTDRLSAEDCLKLLAAAYRIPVLHRIWEKDAGTIMIQRSGETVKEKMDRPVSHIHFPAQYRAAAVMTGSWSEGKRRQRNFCAIVTDQKGRNIALVTMRSSSEEQREAAVLKLLNLSELFLDGRQDAGHGTWQADNAIPFDEAEACMSCLLPDDPQQEHELLYCKKEKEPLCPASLEKLLTALTASDYLRDPEQKIVVLPCDLQSGSGSFVQEGDVLTVRSLLAGMLTGSSNTCAMALARAAGEEILRAG